MKVVEFEGVVTEVRPGEVPGILVAKIESDDRKLTATVDMHVKVRFADENDRVRVTISTELPEFVKGVDFVARGVPFYVSLEGERRKIQISIGGLQFILTGDPEVLSSIRIEPFKEVYIKIAKIT